MTAFYLLHNSVFPLPIPITLGSIWLLPMVILNRSSCGDRQKFQLRRLGLRYIAFCLGCFLFLSHELFFRAPFTNLDVEFLTYGGLLWSFLGHFHLVASTDGIVNSWCRKIFFTGHWIDYAEN